MMQSIVNRKVHDLYAQGYCTLDSVFTADELSDQESILYLEWTEKGRPSLTDWGYPVDIRSVPNLAAYHALPLVHEIVEATLRDRPRLCHTSARISNEESLKNIGWHHHYSWDPVNIARRTRIERILVFYYV
jgi:hypothetical protein